MNGTVQELQELRQLQFRAGLVDTQGLQRAGLAFQQLGVDSREGADFFAESVSEIRLRLGELAAEGKQSQLELAEGLGVDLSALANLGDEELVLAQFEHVRRVFREQGADTARALSESFQGGVEAQRLASIAALPQAEYEAFIAILREGSTTSEETFRDIQRMGVGFGVAGNPGGADQAQRRGRSDSRPGRAAGPGDSHHRRHGRLAGGKQDRRRHHRRGAAGRHRRADRGRGPGLGRSAGRTGARRDRHS